MSVDTPRNRLKHEERSQENHKLSLFSGPIPPPSMLQQYENIAPGLASRLIEMAEKEGEHRRFIESEFLLHNANLKKRGQICAVIIGLVGLMGSVAVGIWGNSNIVSGSLGLGSIGLMVLGFLGTGAFKNKIEEE